MSPASYWLLSAVKVRAIPSFSHLVKATMRQNPIAGDWELIAEVSLFEGADPHTFANVLPGIGESVEATQQRATEWLKQCIRNYLRVNETVVSLHDSDEISEFWLAHEEWEAGE